MIGLETLTGPTHAVATVGLVLGESVALYFGYGAVNAAIAPVLLGTIEED